MMDIYLLEVAVAVDDCNDDNDVVDEIDDGFDGGNMVVAAVAYADMTPLSIVGGWCKDTTDNEGAADDELIPDKSVDNHVEHS